MCSLMISYLGFVNCKLSSVSSVMLTTLRIVPRWHGLLIFAVFTHRLKPNKENLFQNVLDSYTLIWICLCFSCVFSHVLQWRTSKPFLTFLILRFHLLPRLKMFGQTIHLEVKLENQKLHQNQTQNLYYRFKTKWY